MVSFVFKAWQEDANQGRRISLQTTTTADVDDYIHDLEDLLRISIVNQLATDMPTEKLQS